MNRYVERALCRADARDVINVSMREQDVSNRDSLRCGECEQAVHLVTGIDEHTVARTRTGDDEAILEEGADCLRLDYDHVVILAILDDLLFTSKIRNTAKQLGVPLIVAKSREAALAEMRASRPDTVIIDLNNPRTDPLGTVAAMKADPELAAIHTVGFVSHVQTELIEAARTAGVTEVMARSLFAERLPLILGRSH
jgi:PleD family two-component response regulator